jgi:prevent-host-death family protein
MSKSRARKTARRVKETAVAPYGPAEVSASKLKNEWHYWLERVAKRRETVTVTRYGKPVATLAPVAEETEPFTLFGSMRGSVLSYGDLISPTGEVWNAMKDDGDPDDPFDLK